MIAALYVQTGGSYYNLPDVDPYDEARDARIYMGPWPVVAHPPCQRYGRFWKGQPGNIMFGLAKPPRQGGWIKADDYGWTCRVEQGQYGHYCPKGTWLYAVGCDLPDLRWGVHPVRDEDFPADAVAKHGIEYCRRAGLMAFKGGGRDSAPRIGTPPPFRDLLIGMARSVVAKEGLE